MFDKTERQLFDVAAVDWPQGAVLATVSHTLIQAIGAVAAPTTRQDDCGNLLVANLALWAELNDDEVVEEDEDIEKNDQATHSLLTERKSSCIKHSGS
jgi:hypothetical protein